jgi:benzoate-CoA ligase
MIDVSPSITMNLFNATADLLDGYASSRVGHPAFIDEYGTLSYGALSERVDRAAAAFTGLGIQAEQRVLLALLDTNDFPVAFLGAIKAGLVPIPMNTLFPAENFAYILADSRGKALVVSIELLPKLREAAGIASWTGTIIVSDPTGTADIGTALRFAEFINGAEPMRDAYPTGADDPCFWLYSSGSTGRPKGTVHIQTSMRQTAELFAKEVLGFSERDIVFSVAKLFFAYGLGNALSFPLAVGATSILYSGRVTPDLVCELLVKQSPTVFCGVPTLFNACLLNPSLPKSGTHALRLCTSAGEVLPAEIGTKWTAHTGVEIIDGIGSTEMLHIFVSNRPGNVRYGTTGTPVPGYLARLVDENGAVVETAGEIGELEISGPTSAIQYWNNREKSRRTFAGEWTRTGDKFQRDADGNYVHCGRSDDMLKVSGIWVSPGEVEAALMAHDIVLECAVIGAADQDGLIKAKAFVVLMPGIERDPNHFDLLKEHVKSRLAPHKYPRWIEFVDELPKTATGKIQRVVLRTREGAART